MSLMSIIAQVDPHYSWMSWMSTNAQVEPWYSWMYWMSIDVQVVPHCTKTFLWMLKMTLDAA